MVEGITSFISVMLRRAHLLPNDFSCRDEVNRWWGYDWNLTPGTSLKDVPLCPFDESKRSLIYYKSFRLQHLIYFTLGKTRYITFLRNLINKQLKTNAGIIAELNILRPVDLNTLLTGWVFGRQYLGYKMSDFAKDYDSDGLSKVEEMALGLSDNVYDADRDGIPDGAEIRALRNPRKTDADGVSQLLRYGPFIDGGQRDWTYFSYSTADDSVDDQVGRSWADMTRMQYYIQGGYLFILVKTRGYPPRSSNVFFDLLIDTDRDYYTDVEFAFLLNNKAYPWQYVVDIEKSSNPTALRAGIARYIEMKIPLSKIPVSDFQVLPIIRNSQTATNLDQWSTWIPTSLP
ncbi:MAG: hypothetical protein IT292_10765 [Deltaproteobacteria bacterium]|nr:hypothetical protein [Deltaproteobacteria bacterium]